MKTVDFASMSDKYKTVQEKAYYVTLTTVGWIDVFTRQEYVYELFENLRFCQHRKGLEIYAYAVMTNHLHLIARSEDLPLNILLGHFKSYTAKRLIAMIESNSRESRREWLLYMFKYYGRYNPQNEVYQLWQNGNHSIELWNGELMRQKIIYTHNNPVKQGIVANPEDYLYSSAAAFPHLKVSEYA